MKLFKTTLLLFLFFISTRSSIAQDFYHLDNDVNMIHLSKLHELKISTNFNPVQKGNIQIGYSPIKHVSIAGAIMYLDQQNQYRRNSFHSQGNSFTSSVGLYTNIIPRPDELNFFPFKIVDAIQLNAHSGYTLGKVKNTLTNLYPGSIETKHHSFFLRYGAHLKMKQLTYSISISYHFINFNKANVGGDHDEFKSYFNKFKRDVVEVDKTSFTAMTMSLSLNFNAVDFFLSANGLLLKNREDLISALYYKEDINFGIIVDMNKVLHLFKKKKTK